MYSRYVWMFLNYLVEESIITDVNTELETQLRWERSKNEKLKQALDVAARQVRVGQSLPPLSCFSLSALIVCLPVFICHHVTCPHCGAQCFNRKYRGFNPTAAVSINWWTINFSLVQSALWTTIWWNVCTNGFWALIAVWLNVSRWSWDDVRLNRSTREYRV